MPKTGGAIKRPTPAPKPAPKPDPPKPAPKPAPKATYGSEAAYTGSAQQQKAGNNKVVDRVERKQRQATSSETSIAPRQQQKAGNNRTQRAISQRNNTPIERAGGAGAKYERTALKQGTATRTARQQAGSTRPAGTRRSGGTATSPQRDNEVIRTRPVVAPAPERDHALVGPSDKGRLENNFRDTGLVGSRNEITEFDGTQFAGGMGPAEGEGGGGDTGSSAAGREAVGLLDFRKGQDVEEAVYGVKRRRGKVAKVRGE